MGKGNVIIKLNGDLGDQMFQWAVGRMIEYTMDMEVYFDKGSEKSYKLAIFKISPKFIEDSLTKLKLNIIWNLRFLLNWSKFLGFTLYSENQFNFDRNINKIRPNTYIEGLFQSELYFKCVENKLREDFQFDLPLDDNNQRFTSQLYSLNSISVYILSDNYVREDKYKNKYAKCSIDYYKAGVEYIAQKHPDPTLIVFSDDINWAKKHFKMPYKTVFVSHNAGKKYYEDLRLMSRCSHNVIANNSFSWWGSWLNKSPDKIVVAPQKWFDSEKIIQTDIVPKDWVRLKN